MRRLFIARVLKATGWLKARLKLMINWRRGDGLWSGIAARALAPTSRAKRPGGSERDAEVDAVQHGR
jgi:hypothetical protein